MSLLTQQQIQKFILRARAQGYTNEQIKAEIARKQQESGDTQQMQTSTPQTNQSVVPQSTQQPTTQMSGSTTQTKDTSSYNPIITGRTVGEYRKALSRAIGAGDTNSAKIIENQMNIEQANYEEWLKSQEPTDEEKAKQKSVQEKQLLYDELSSNAQKILDVINNKDKYDKKEYTTRLEAAVSVYNASAAFTEGGKSFTESEMNLLLGKLIGTRQEAKQSYIGKFLGLKEPKGSKKVEIVDSEDEIKDKLSYIIYGENSPQYDTKAVEKKDSGVIDTLIGAGESGYNLILRPIVSGIEAYSELLATAGYTVYRTARNEIDPEQWGAVDEFFTPIIESKYSDRKQSAINAGLSTLAGVGAVYDIATLGSGNLVKQTIKLGLRNMAVNAPLYGTGNVLEGIRMGEEGEDLDRRFLDGAFGNRYIGIFEGAFGDSSEARTADTVLSIFGPILAGKMYEKVKTGEVLYKPDVEAIKKNANKTFNVAKKDVSGRVATSIFVPDKNSVVKSEKMAKQFISITESKSVRGLAKEANALIPIAGEYIDDAAKNFDRSYGGQPSGEIMSQVKNELLKSSVGQAEPELVNTVVDQMSSQFNGKQASMTALGKGEFSEFIGITDINNSRKFMNSKIGRNWFRQGMPVDSKANSLNMLKFLASQELKNIIMDIDGAKHIGDAIEAQHLAISSEPILSSQSLGHSYSSGGITSAMWNTVVNAFGAALEPVKIGIVRKTSGINKPTFIGEGK